MDERPRPLNLIVTVTILPEDTPDFLTAMQIDCLGSRQEPECLAFDVLQSQTEPFTFYFYESYVNEKALLYHKTTPHFAAWTAFKDSGRVQSISVVRAQSLF